LGDELDYETVTVKVVSAIAPVVVDRKLSDVRKVVGASGEHLFCSRLPQTATVAPESLPVSDNVGEKIWDVPGLGSAREHLPTLPAIVEKQTIQFSEELGPPTAAVSAARKTVPVTVGEKHSFFSGSVAFFAFVWEKIKGRCTFLG